MGGVGRGRRIILLPSTMVWKHPTFVVFWVRFKPTCIFIVDMEIGTGDLRIGHLFIAITRTFIEFWKAELLD